MNGLNSNDLYTPSTSLQDAAEARSFLGAKVPQPSPEDLKCKKVVGEVMEAKGKVTALNLESPLRHRRLSQIFPLPTGSHTVGCCSTVLKVPADYCSKNGTNEKIGVEIFSPMAAKLSGNKLLMKMGRNFPYIDKLKDKEIESLQTHALMLEHLDPVAVKSKPILIFSHGMVCSSTVYRPLIEELASHGFVVLNLNHPASSDTFKDDEEAAKDPSPCKDALDLDDFHSAGGFGNPKIDDIAETMAVTGAANIRFVVEQIRNGKIKVRPYE
jgi:hypothetical protein